MFLVVMFQQQNQMRERVFTLSHKLSAMTFGQDRYRRRYWVLPKCGGILVEGLESSEPESADPNAPEIDKKVDQSVDKDQCFKPVTPPNVEESSVKVEQTENSCMATDTNSGTENKVTIEDLSVQSTVGTELRICDKRDVKGDDENSVIKQENETAESNTLKAEVVSLNCLIGDEVKVNGEMSVMDCRNGFIDLKNCIRTDGGCVKVEAVPVSSPSVTDSDTKQGNLADDSCKDMNDEMPTADIQLISVAESATNDSIQSSLCCDHDQPSSTPGKDDILPLQHSSLLQLAVSNAGLIQLGAISSQSISSSRRTSQVATPSSEVGAGIQLDLSTASTPVSFMQRSQLSTPSFADDFQLSADGELQPDYLAIPQNVQPISRGNLCLVSLVVCKYVDLLKRPERAKESCILMQIGIFCRKSLFMLRHILCCQYIQFVCGAL